MTGHRFVFSVFCFPPVFLCSSPAWFPSHLSHISLISTALFPVSLHLHLIPSLVWFVLKLFPLFVDSSVPVLVSVLLSSCIYPYISPAPVPVPHVLDLLPAVFWVVRHFVVLFLFGGLLFAFRCLPFHGLDVIQARCLLSRPAGLFACTWVLIISRTVTNLLSAFKEQPHYIFSRAVPFRNSHPFPASLIDSDSKSCKL